MTPESLSPAASEAIPFARVAISPVEYLQEAWSRVKPQYGLFLGITAVGMLLGSVAPLGILLGPMFCGIYLCYRRQALGQPIAFDMLFKGFDYFGEAFIASLLMVGAALVVMLPLMVALFIGMFATALGGAAGHGAETVAPFLSCALFGVFFLLVMLISAVISVLFAFSFPLVMDRGVPGLEAVKLSFRAARANLGGLLLLALVNALLGFAGVLCCYVGAFLVLPVTIGTHWICYERVFGIKEADGVASQGAC